MLKYSGSSPHLLSSCLECSTPLPQGSIELELVVQSARVVTIQSCKWAVYIHHHHTPSLLFLPTSVLCQNSPPLCIQRCQLRERERERESTISAGDSRQRLCLRPPCVYCHVQTKAAQTEKERESSLNVFTLFNEVRGG